MYLNASRFPAGMAYVVVNEQIKLQNKKKKTVRVEIDSHNIKFYEYK